MTDRVTITVTDQIADVRLTRADKMNALDPAMFAAIGAAIDSLARRTDVRCVVLSGEGRAFCAGLDMASMAGGGSGTGRERNDQGSILPQHVTWGWRNLPMPVIAAVHGVAFGGGFQIMSGADIRICAPDSRFAIRETYWGLVPDMAGFPIWRGLVRDDVLRELVYTAREFDAGEAFVHGFVTRIADDPHAAAMDLARAIAARNPHAIRGAKRLCNMAHDADPRAMLEAETTEQIKVIGQPNMMEAVAANMAKREAVFVD
ncbi:crotonase/enoyl-CoA hydratase family protein [Sphingomonas oligophenolica]|uniref:Crotonase/enoyl-CoA hydratase family protein n=1 Tax=Sphingomonas oligophenolica TaxID=301154 RepID=A0A502CM56_9SPHN|nr:crotonase/enoyl-CoA hydratase family protein [Sphingomonas oligophenolica]TPG13714.1 crotonase/enoyl-CoA hydratase family protein [Sphingomonas oligophenolica]